MLVCHCFFPRSCQWSRSVQPNNQMCHTQAVSHHICQRFHKSSSIKFSHIGGVFIPIVFTFEKKTQKTWSRFRAVVYALENVDR